MTTELTCPECQETFDLERHTGWRIAAGVAGGIVGTAVARNFLMGVASAAVTYWIAGRVNRRFWQTCPSCEARVDGRPKKQPVEPVAATPRAA